MGNFDPYLAWLDIPSDQRPATHYRLLGIREFESDPQTVNSAADRVLGHLVQYRQGQDVAQCDRLVQEVQAARACLLDPSRKDAYDSSLRQGMSSGAAGQAASMYPPASPAQEQQIRQAPPVPGGQLPFSDSQERQMGQAPPVPGGPPARSGQERKLPPPPSGPQIRSAPPVPGPVPSTGTATGGGETAMRPPAGGPVGPSSPGTAGASPPSGQQMASPGAPGAFPPGASGVSPPSSVVGTAEQPLSGPPTGLPSPGGPSPGAPAARPMPRDVLATPTGPVSGAPSVPMGPGQPAAGGQPGAAPYQPPGAGGAQSPGMPTGLAPERPMHPGGVPMPQGGAPMQMPGQTPGMPAPGAQPYQQMAAQPSVGYGQPSAPGSVPGQMPPTGPAAGPPVQLPAIPQGGAPSWAPEQRTGIVGTSVADAVAGKRGSSPEPISFASRESCKPRRTKSSSYTALVIVFAGAIVLLGLICALAITHLLVSS